MTNPEPSIEARILHSVKRTLAAVIRDTATPHGMRHPLSDSTIEDLRQCLVLISARERELAQDAGAGVEARPRFGDEQAGAARTIRVHRPPRAGEDPEQEGGENL